MDTKSQHFKPITEYHTSAEIAQAREKATADTALLSAKIGEIAGERTAAIAKLAGDATLNEIDRREELAKRQIGRLNSYDAQLAEQYPKLKRAEELAKVAEPYAALRKLVDQERAIINGKDYRLARATLIGLAEIDEQRKGAQRRCQQLTTAYRLTPDELAALPVIPRPYDTIVRHIDFADSLNLPALLSSDAQDETQVPYWTAAVQGAHAGRGGTISTAELARQRAPAVIEQARPVTDAERAAAGPPSANRIRVPGTPADPGEMVGRGRAAAGWV